jgi:long-chain fatty acid transport protein
MSRRLLSVLMLLALVSSVFASNGTQIGTVGARGTAMGSAFRGLADDWSAAYYNPAGATQFGKWEVGLSLGYIMPRGSYEALPYPAAPFAGMKSGAVDASPNNFLVPALGIFYKPCEKWTVGLGVYAPNGLGTEWDLLEVPAGYGNASAMTKKNETFSDHQVIDIQPTVAYKVSDKLSVGLGVKYTWGKMTLDQVVLPYNPLLASWATINTVLPMVNAMNPAVPASLAWNADWNRLIAASNLDGTGSAYGANVGLLYKFSDKLSVGLDYKYSTDLKLKGSMKQRVILPTNATYATVLSGVATALAANPATAAYAPSFVQAAGAFSGATYLDEDLDGIEADLPLPWTAGIGLAYKPTSRLTFTADAMLTNWDAWDKIEVKKDGEVLTTLQLGWSNTLEIGAGAEYLAWDGGCKKLFVRAGGYMVPTPVPDSTMSPTLLDPNDRTIVSGGLGLEMGKFAVDVSFEHVFFADKTIDAYSPAVSPDGMYENFAGNYKFNANVITVAFTYSIP